ncbi:MAG: hypothetical protein M3Z05_16840 [Gemmatimonadota bacterium]|nr:hypothetical protein [Gemmatimonadota bacterium]
MPYSDSPTPGAAKMPNDLSLIPSDERLSEEDAHRVLARAVELDARESSALSVLQLREIAVEAGISLSALEQALAEQKQHTAAASLSQAKVVEDAVESSQAPTLSLRLVRYRWYAAGVSYVIAAMITPGDVLVQTVLWAAPFIGAYELAIALLRRSEHREDKPRTAPPRSAMPAGEPADHARPSRNDVLRSLRLRPA